MIDSVDHLGLCLFLLLVENLDGRSVETIFVLLELDLIVNQEVHKAFLLLWGQKRKDESLGLLSLVIAFVVVIDGRNAAGLGALIEVLRPLI